MISRDEFATLVKDALSNLYDPVRLQVHPLVELLGVVTLAGEVTGEALRRTLREAIDVLKPAPTVPLGRPEWLGYRVLLWHYVRLLSQAETCRELGLSESTFYRRQKEGLEAMASLLWARYRGASADAGVAAAPRPQTGADSSNHAVRFAESSPRQRVRSQDLLASIHRTVAPLAERRGIAVQMDVPPDLPALYTAPDVFRQVLINLVALGISRLSSQEAAAAGAGECGTPLGRGELRLTVTLSGEEALWRLRGLGAVPDEQVLAEGAYRISRDLLAAAGGRLWLESGQGRALELCFAVPVAKRRLVLLIDDDPGTIALYRRYLQRADLDVCAAQTAAEADTMLALGTPDLILLDVMLPSIDGWSVLQHLKATGETAAIPIVIISVIDQPQLALALGATQVLRKPIRPEELLVVVERLLS